MRLHRPYVPLRVRLAVAERQAEAKGCRIEDGVKPALKLKALLRFLFGDAIAHLDHDPALQNRERYADRSGIHYVPDANDPDYLIYRKADDHKIKTLVRGDGAQLSDAALARKNKRIARNRDPDRKKFRWPKRKIRNRKNVCGV